MRNNQSHKSHEAKNRWFGLGKRSALLFGVVVLAASGVIYASSAAYRPGETLDPSCLPTDPNCTVILPAASGDNTDITSLNGTNIANFLTINSNFSGDVSGTAGALTIADGAIGAAKLANAISLAAGQSISAGAGTLTANALVAGTYGISISGNAQTVTNGIYSNQTYNDPTWLATIAGSKIVGTVTSLVIGNATTSNATTTNLSAARNISAGTMNTVGNAAVGGDLNVTGGLTLGGQYRTTWPVSAGSGGGSWWATSSNSLVGYPGLAGNYAVVIGASATTSNVRFEVNGNSKFGGALTLTGDFAANNFSGSSAGVNTGDETQSSIKTKLSAAGSGSDGYLTAADWASFNSKSNWATSSSDFWLTTKNLLAFSTTSANYWAQNGLTFGLATFTQATSTNFFANILTAATGLFTNLFATNATTTNLAVSGTLTATNASATTTLAGGLNVAGSSGLTVLQNGNVGIGTMNPGAPLEINKTLNGSSGREYGLKINVTNNQSGSAGYSGLYFNVAQTTTGSGYHDLLELAYGGATKLEIGDDGWISTVGGLKNVSSINNAKLMVDTTGTTISRNQADANSALIVNQVNAGSTGDILDLQAGGATKVAFLQNGNVGIGTTSPFAKLSVMNTAGGVAPLFAVASSTNGLGTSTALYVAANGNVGIGTTTPVAPLEISPAIVSGAPTNAYGLKIDKFNANGATYAYGLYVTSPTGAASSNYGIFVTDADSGISGSNQTQIYAGSIAMTGGLKNYSSQNNSYINTDTTGTIISRNVADTNPALIIQQSNSGSTGDILQVKNNSVKALTVQQNGNVGISTTSPFAKLSLAGDAYLGGNVTATGTLLVYGSSTLQNMTALNATFTQATSTNFFANILTAASGLFTNLFATNATTTNSTSTNSYATSLVAGNATATNLSVSGALTATNASATTTLAGGLNVAGSSGLTVLQNGNVGIGATSPVTALDVNGALTIEGSGSNGDAVMNVPANKGLQIIGNAAAAFRLLAVNNDTYFQNTVSSGTTNFTGLNGADLTGAMNFKSTGDINFGGTGATRMVLKSTTGDLGIGTISPFAKLAVLSTSGDLTPLFSVASSTAGAGTTTVFQIENNGSVNIGGGNLAYDANTGITTANALNVGSLNFESDAGMVTWVDMPVTASSSQGTIESYTAALGGNPALTVIGTVIDANGTLGSVDVAVGSSTMPTGRLTVFGDGTSTIIANFVNSASNTVMTVNENGNVGIGTSSPFVALAVNGDAYMGNVTATGTLLVYGSSTLQNMTALNATFTQATSTSFYTNLLAAVTGAITNFLATNATTTNSTSTNSYATSLVAGNATATNLSVSGTLTATNAAATTTIAGGLTVSGATGLSVFQNGTVAIGTNNPWSKLDVVNTSGSDKTPLLLLRRASLSTALGNPILGIGDSNDGSSDYHTIGFGYISQASDYYPAEIGYQNTNNSGSTAGDLIFATRSVTTNTIPTERLRITANGLIGIGTSTPGALLAIHATAGGTTPLLTVASSTAGAGTTTLFQIDGYGNTSIGNGLTYDANAGQTSINGLLTGPLNFESDAGNVSWIDMPVTSATLQGMTDSYTANLGGLPILTLAGTVTDANGTLGSLGVTIGSSTPGFAHLTVFGDGTGPLANLVNAASSTVLTALENGNVGVGTAAPSTLLQVGHGNLGVYSALFKVQGIAGSLSVAFPTNNLTTLSDSGGTAWLSEVNGGNVGMGTTTGLAQLTVSRPSTNSADMVNIYSLDNSPTRAALHIQGGNGANEVLWAASNGNVGIGTAAPSARLMIKQSTEDSANGMLKLVSSDATDYANMTLWTGATNKAANARNWQISSNYQVAGNLDIMRSTTNTGNPTTEAMSIDLNGNVGIGTTTPGYNFVVEGATGGIFLNRTAANEPFLLLESQASPSSGGQIRGLVAGGIRFTNTASNVEYLRVDSSGNLGIGTTTPATKLGVIGSYDNTVANTGQIRLGESGGYFGSLGYDEAGATTLVFDNSYSNNNAAISMRIANNPELSILGSGNVGIGETAPNAKLVIKNSSTTAQGVLKIVGAQDLSTYENYPNGYSGGADYGTIINGYALSVGPYTRVTDFVSSSVGQTNVAGSVMRFLTQPQDINSGPQVRLFIDQNGNVGIGTSSPMSRFSVWGDSYLGGNVTATGTLLIWGSTTLQNFTAINGTTTNATTSNLAISSLGTAAGAFLAINGNGQVIATSTPVLSNLAGAVTDAQVPDTITINGTNNVTVASMAQIAANSILGNQTNGTGNVTALATSTLQVGRADKWSTPRSFTTSGDVVVASTNWDGSGNFTAAATIQNSAVTYAKMQNVSAFRLLGNNTASAAAPMEIATSSLGLLPTSYLSIDGTFAANSDTLIPSQKAVKTYVTAHSGSSGTVSNAASAGMIPYYASSGTTLTATDSIAIDPSTGAVKIKSLATGYSGSPVNVCVDPTTGQIFPDNGTGCYTSSSPSDARLKANIRPISSSLDVIGAVRNIHGVYYNWDKTNPREVNATDALQVGMIAQNIEQYLPELVSYDSDGYRRLDYTKFTGFLAEAANIEQGEIDFLNSFASSTAQDQVNMKANIAALQAQASKWNLDDNGVLTVTTLKTQNLWADTGMTTKDKATGEYYCMYIENGAMKSAKGRCEDIATSTSPANESTTTDTVQFINTITSTTTADSTATTTPDAGAQATSGTSSGNDSTSGGATTGGGAGTGTGAVSTDSTQASSDTSTASASAPSTSDSSSVAGNSAEAASAPASTGN